MARAMVAPSGFGIVDRRDAIGTNATSSTSFLGTPLNYVDITKMRARLTAINGTRYTSAYLDVMTMNDMVYALRTLDDPASI